MGTRKSQKCPQQPADYKYDLFLFGSILPSRVLKADHMKWRERYWRVLHTQKNERLDPIRRRLALSWLNHLEEPLMFVQLRLKSHERSLMVSNSSEIKISYRVSSLCCGGICRVIFSEGYNNCLSWFEASSAATAAKRNTRWCWRWTT